jgi:hypothetical protein
MDNGLTYQDRIFPGPRKLESTKIATRLNRPMWMFMIAVMSILTASAMIGTGVQREPKPEAVIPKNAPNVAEAQAMFDQLKSLAGSWEMEHEGKMQIGLVSRLISNGSVLEERMFPGTSHEMVNMYHLDGDSVVCTHYCGVGNQPRMRCKAGKEGEFDFTFESATNLKAPTDMYMGRLLVKITGKDTLVQEWTSYVDGKPSREHDVKLLLKRKPDATPPEAPAKPASAK